MMKAVRWHGPRDMRLEQIKIPAPQSHEALVRIRSVGVCGSDMHYYLDGKIGNQVVTEPLVLGHEYAGAVEAVGEEADPALVGKRVAVEPGIPCLKCEWCRTGHYNVCNDMFFPGGPGCDGALCEYIAVHHAFCFPIPDSMTDQVAAMIEPVAVALHTIELAKITPGETVGIVGLGPIGLLTAQVAKLSGAQVVYGCDLHPYRIEASSAHGVDVAFKASTPESPDGEDAVERIMAETKGRGVDVAIDCANTGGGLDTACRITRPAGRCVLTGISGNDADPIPVSVVRRRELNLQWCRRFRFNFPASIELVHRGKVHVESLITHSFPLEKTKEAFDLVAGYAGNVLKASIDQ